MRPGDTRFTRMMLSSERRFVRFYARAYDRLDHRRLSGDTLSDWMQTPSTAAFIKADPE